MDSQLGSSLPQIWCIEALACSDHIEPTLLLDLIKETPQLANDIGKNAREWVSLKFLESLFIQGARANPVPSASRKKVRLDPSDHCEDVLRKILSETSLSHLKSAGPEILKWDLEPFIQHKKSNLPRHALKQLKDAILKGSPSISTSLKERSGLPVESYAEHQAPAKDGNCNGNTTHRVECHVDDGNLLPRDLPDENLVPVNRKRRASESPDEQLYTICPQYKYSQDLMETINSRDQSLLADASKRYSKERCSLEKDTCVGVMRRNGSPGNGNNQCNSSKELVGNVQVLPHCGMEVPNKNFVAAMQNSEGETREDRENGFHALISTKEDIDKYDQNFPRTVPTVGEAEGDVDSSSDSDGYHDERTTIDTKKRTFLSSQCTFAQDSAQDSLATNGERELHICMKCRKGGNLLACTADSCPIVIHESCLGSDVVFDTRETFYCPFCAYSQAISKYIEVKKFVILARKDFATFICLEPQNEPNKQSCGSFRMDGNCLKQNDGLPKSNEVNQINFLEKVDNHQERKKLEYEQAGPSGRKATDSTDRLIHSLKTDKQDGKGIGQESRLLRGGKWKPIAAEAVHNSQTETVVSETSGSEKHADLRSKKGVPRLPETDLPCERKCSQTSQSNDAEDFSEEENEDSGASKYHVRDSKQESYSLYPAIPQMRRKRVPWTTEEEDKLKEGMRECCLPHDIKIPWTKILRYGIHVFQPSRTTQDLKDKWRNLCKANSDSK